MSEKVNFENRVVDLLELRRDRVYVAIFEDSIAADQLENLVKEADGRGVKLLVLDGDAAVTVKELDPEKRYVVEVASTESGETWRIAERIVNRFKGYGLNVSVVAGFAITERPKIVYLAGRARFTFELDTERRLTLEGVIVLHQEIYQYPNLTGSPTFEEKERLDALNLRKIDLADEVVVVNDGYVDEATTREIAYAREKRKPIRYAPPLPLETAPEVTE